MRNIKFRGLTGTTKGKEWIYGYYYKVKSFFCDKEGHFISVIRSDHLQDCNIDEKTLGQYTGLKDKNGTEVFEGDIVLINKEKNIKGIVKYSETYAEFVVVNTNNTADDYEPLADYKKHLEILGNEYENPELLEKEGI